MKFFHMLSKDLQRTICSLGFLAAVLLTMLLMFTATAYVDSKEQSFSVFECIFLLDREIILNDYNFSSIFIFQRGMNGYITMFIPIIAAFPFMKTFCEERNSGMHRFFIMRAGSRIYYLSKTVTAVSCGALAVMSGLLLFGGLIFFIFPGISDYEMMDNQLLPINTMLPNGMVITIIKEFVSAFFYGMVMTLPALFVSSFCKNPYLITGIPFFLVYIHQVCINKMYQKAIECGDFERAGRIYDYAPNSIKNIFLVSETESIKRIVMINGIFLVVSVICFMKISICRREWGK